MPLDPSGGRWESLPPLADKARAWLWTSALPLWSSIGVDADLGFTEHLTLQGRRADVEYKRLRVQARQIYVFSHASTLGYEAGADAARNGWEFMTTHGWLASGGWARRCGRMGGVLDPTLDLYDQAFGLLATAWWLRANDDQSAVAYADDTLAAIDHRLRVPGVPGWQSAEDQTQTREQNPHMHLLEGLLALHEATGESRFLDRAAEVIELFESTLFDDHNGVLHECFGADWSPLSEPRGRLVEPGHHFEWVWLLHQAERYLPGASRLASALFDFATQHGIDQPSGAVIDAVLDDGTPADRGTRTWPHTEEIKAHLARLEATGEFDEARFVQLVDLLFSKFLSRQPAGTWDDHFAADGALQVDKIPASSLYHVFLAFAELMRVAERVPGNVR
ncbi:MAG: AGE family epimerase/isomerase [Patulibacter sp.]